MDSLSGVDFISALPEELSMQVLSKLSTPELAICELVSKNWKRFAEDDALWRANFSHMPGAEIINKMTARAYFGVNITVNTKEKLTEKIKNFFELHKANRVPVINMHYQSGSKPNSSWDYVMCKNADTIENERACYTSEKFNFFDEVVLNITGFGEADLSFCEMPFIESVKLPSEKKYYGVIERIKNCTFTLINEITQSL